MKPSLDHYKLYKYADRIKSQSIDNIQYKDFTYVINGIKERIIFICGSNEGKDWAVNTYAFGLTSHRGYQKMAKKLMKHLGIKRKTIFIGQSFGGGIVVEINRKYRYLCKWSMTTGCPASVGVLNFGFRPKNHINYRIITDPVPTSWILWPWFRHAVKPTYLKDVEGFGFTNHLKPAYNEAFKKYFNL